MLRILTSAAIARWRARLDGCSRRGERRSTTPNLYDKIRDQERPDRKSRRDQTENRELRLPTTVRPIRACCQTYTCFAVRPIRVSLSDLHALSPLFRKPEMGHYGPLALLGLDLDDTGSFQAA